MNKKKLIIILSPIVLLAAGAGVAGWDYAGKDSAVATKASVNKVTQQLRLDSQVVSVKGKDGTAHFLVVDATLSVGSVKPLPPDWAKDHAAEMSSVALSQLLTIPNLADAPWSVSVRNQILATIAQGEDKILPDQKPYFAHVNQVWLTKLLLQ